MFGASIDSVLRFLYVCMYACMYKREDLAGSEGDVKGRAVVEPGEVEGRRARIDLRAGSKQEPGQGSNQTKSMGKSMVKSDHYHAREHLVRPPWQILRH